MMNDLQYFFLSDVAEIPARVQADFVRGLEPAVAQQRRRRRTFGRQAGGRQRRGQPKLHLQEYFKNRFSHNHYKHIGSTIKKHFKGGHGESVKEGTITKN